MAAKAGVYARHTPLLPETTVSLKSRINFLPSLLLSEILPGDVVMLLMCMRDAVEYHLKAAISF